MFISMNGKEELKTLRGEISIVHKVESLSVITHGPFCRCWYTDIQRCSIGEREPIASFIWICQEGRIMRTLIGMIHSSAKHNKQLCFQRSETAAVRSCFSPHLQKVWRLRRDYEDVPVVPSPCPAKLGPLFFGRMPPRQTTARGTVSCPKQFGL